MDPQRTVHSVVFRLAGDFSTSETRLSNDDVYFGKFVFHSSKLDVIFEYQVGLAGLNAAH